MISADSWKHFEFLFSGATLMGLAGHAVNTFPTPKNVYGQWLLGVVKFAVGQRISAMNAFQGHDTAVIAVPQGSGGGIGTSQAARSMKTDITPEGITTETEETLKTSKTIPIPAPPDPPKV